MTGMKQSELIDNLARHHAVVVQYSGYEVTLKDARISFRSTWVEGTLRHVDDALKGAVKGALNRYIEWYIELIH